MFFDYLDFLGGSRAKGLWGSQNKHAEAMR
jgi:hypothetical protein